MRHPWLTAVILFAAFHNAAAQDISFFHLDKSDGLSDNQVQCALTDKNGLLWIGTADGLNSYDGYTLKNFHSRTYPGLQNDGIVRMVCDDKNRIWIQCRNGLLSVLDEKRRFHPVNTMENGKKVNVDYLLPSPERTMFLSQGRVFGLPNADTIHFAPLQMKEEPLLRNTFERINRWDRDNLVFSGNGLLFLFNVKELKTSAPIPVPSITAAARLNQEEAIATSAGNGKLYRVNLSSGRIVKTYSGMLDQYGQAMHNDPRSIYHLQDQQFFITSPSAGAYVFDAGRETLKRYRHDPADNRTIANNTNSFIFSDSSGFFFITSPGTGLDYFRLNSPQAAIKSVFQDKLTGSLYDGSITGIAADSKGNTWLAARNTLIEWNRETGETIFHSSGKKKDIAGIRTIYIDQQDRIWLGLPTGISVLNSRGQLVKELSSSGADALPRGTVNKISSSPDGRLWVCTSKGICFIDPLSFNVQLPPENSYLRAIRDKNCNTVFFGAGPEVWIGTWEGAYRINLSNGATALYTTENGLIFNEVTGFADDPEGNIYIGTRYGFHVLEPGKPPLAYKQIDNAWPVDCHSLVKDKQGNIWFANNDYLARYSPGTKSFRVFDERTGISNSGFSFYAAHATDNGELLFGTNKGVTYFEAKNIRIPELPLSVMIHGMETPDSLYRFSKNPVITLPFSSNTVSFSFSAINLLKSKTIFYQFMLEGADKSWINTLSGQRVNYNKLKPGDYVFRVRASGDNIHWTEASNPLAFSIKKPWWYRWWFIAVCVLGATGITGMTIRQRNRKSHRQKEQLETEQAINYLASSIYEQRTVDAILWDVAKNCIGRLKFEDCVIYLMDENRDALVQRAAWGPKASEKNQIVLPLEIPLGSGIVGSVAQSGQAEIIPDTSKDKRYIVDDVRRLSEITVPIVYNGKVLGIIDSEHPKKKFFTRQHLSILTTIASLCANKIIRLKAEEATQKAQLELLKHEREAVEAQLKSLRLQMNPHFLFNSLNSIQQMILSGEDTAATRYLSKFSRLLRLILLHSDKETITLKEELETLSLYLALESLRFKDAFKYSLLVDELLDPGEIKIPAMLIQPFAENAIWHGLMHKQGERCLEIKFSESNDESLVCRIEDNGIGREAAGKINGGIHSGKGISVAEERLSAYNLHHSLKSSVSIEDLRDKNRKAAGTRVTLVLPML